MADVLYEEVFEMYCTYTVLFIFDTMVLVFSDLYTSL